MCLRILWHPQGVKNLFLELAYLSFRTNSKRHLVWHAGSVIYWIYLLPRKLFLAQVESLKRLWRKKIFLSMACQLKNVEYNFYRNFWVMEVSYLSTCKLNAALKKLIQINIS